ncbi:uncharacterized protein LOC112564683 [Pomacea canaliculata]|nr:uncharacterized protein LOC112564683 [Pomacea canaliculata]XP_025095464.1 uncharacterized protein LOC112564683 [Pomacea canaliculata]
MMAQSSACRLLLLFFTVVSAVSCIVSARSIDFNPLMHPDAGLDEEPDKLLRLAKDLPHAVPDQSSASETRGELLERLLRSYNIPEYRGHESHLSSEFADQSCIPICPPSSLH